MTQPLSRSWMPSGTCAQVDMDSWYPVNGAKPGGPVRMCTACPVRPECLDYVMALELGKKRHDREGIWAGLFPQERIDFEAEWLAGTEAAA